MEPALTLARLETALQQVPMSSLRAPEITQEDGVTVIALGPEYDTLDEPVLDEVKSAILNAADNAEPPLVVLDLSHTRFFGSAFIEILFRAWKRLQARPAGRFCLTGLTEHCREVVEVTHLDQIWDIAGTREDAVRLLKAG